MTQAILLALWVGAVAFAIREMCLANADNEDTGVRVWLERKDAERDRRAKPVEAAGGNWSRDRS